MNRNDLFRKYITYTKLKRHINILMALSWMIAFVIPRTDISLSILSVVLFLSIAFDIKKDMYGKSHLLIVTLDQLDYMDVSNLEEIEKNINRLIKYKKYVKYLNNTDRQRLEQALKRETYKKKRP